MQKCLGLGLEDSKLVVLSLNSSIKNMYCMTSKRTPVCATRRGHFSCGRGIAKSSKQSVMLGHASQTSWAIQNMHDKPGNLPDPDIFTFDTYLVLLILTPLIKLALEIVNMVGGESSLGLVVLPVDGSGSGTVLWNVMTRSGVTISNVAIEFGICVAKSATSGLLPKERA